MKWIFFIFSFCIFPVSLYCGPPIVLSPNDQTYLYTNFTNDLYPFLYTDTIYKIDHKINLKLLDELHYTNGFFHDVVKVEIMNGLYKGTIGYVLEENVNIPKDVLKNPVYVFFKNDVELANKNLKVKKGTICQIEDSRLELENEFYYLKIMSGKNKGARFEYGEKSNLHFIINKASELAYYLRNHYNIVKTVHASYLTPLENIPFSDQKSDPYGLIYTKKNMDPDIQTKQPQYSQPILEQLFPGEKIFINFLLSLDTVTLKPDTNYYDKLFYHFKINNRSPHQQELKIHILSDTDFSLFAYPPINQKNFTIIGGFYIHDKNHNINIQMQLDKKIKTPVILMKYHEKKREWTPWTTSSQNAVFQADYLTKGYYLFLHPREMQYLPVKLNKKTPFQTSRVYIKNKESTFTYQTFIIPKEHQTTIYLPEGDYELLFFCQNDPDRFYQKQFFINKGKHEVVIDDQINSTQYIKNPAVFHPLYKGKWILEGIKKDNRIKQTDNILEYLGNMTLHSLNYVTFDNSYFNMQGKIEIINEDQIMVHIYFLSNTIVTKEYQQIFRVSPSLFYTELLIPAYFSFYLGMIQISFDHIYFARKRFYQKSLTGSIATMESLTYNNPAYPDSEKNSRYKLFFTKE